MEATKINIEISVANLYEMRTAVENIKCLIKENHGIDFSAKINVLGIEEAAEW